MASEKLNKKLEEALMTEIWDPALAEDPEKFMMFAFPWGKENTPLHDKKGPRVWQREEFQAIKDHIKSNKELIAAGLPPRVYQSAIASGRGIGKSAFFSMLTLWMESCNIGATTIVTANNEAQLKSRTWAELGKWHTLSINSHWFDRNAMSLRPAEWYEKALKQQLKIDTAYFYANAQLWSEETPDAFAGAHNERGMLLVYDEASGIPASIWKVSEGFFTEPILHRYWFSFSNPRRNTGAFFECFHKHRAFWKRRNIDSRSVEGTDKEVLQGIVEKYGEDSDEARVEVKGLFPRQGDRQFISRDSIEKASERTIEKDNYAPLIMGVDVARFGSDSTVIRFRRGRDARSIPAIKAKGLDNMQVADLVAEWIEKTNPDAVAIDAGNGTGVIDRLRALKYVVHEVWFGAKSADEEWVNVRTMIWARMREWLGGGCIDKDQELMDDLAGPEYKYQGNSDKILLEAKEEMKKRGLASPDNGDALACTFAVKPARKDLAASRQGIKSKMAKNVDYDVFS